jgi:hypothetical protein
LAGCFKTTLNKEKANLSASLLRKNEAACFKLKKQACESDLK